MIAVVQRVTRAAVTVAGESIGAIGRGLAVLAAVERGDGVPQARWMAAKLAGLRVFPDPAGQKPYDLDVRQTDGAVLLVSNFTVAAACERGRRPSLDPAASPDEAQVVFDRLVELMRAEGVPVETGRFGADMLVSLDNDGPVTFVVRTPGR